MWMMDDGKTCDHEGDGGKDGFGGHNEDDCVDNNQNNKRNNNKDN